MSPATASRRRALRTTADLAHDRGARQRLELSWQRELRRASANDIDPYAPSFTTRRTRLILNRARKLMVPLGSTRTSKPDLSRNSSRCLGPRERAQLLVGNYHLVSVLVSSCTVYTYASVNKPATLIPAGRGFRRSVERD